MTTRNSIMFIIMVKHTLVSQIQTWGFYVGTISSCILIPGHNDILCISASSKKGPCASDGATEGHDKKVTFVWACYENKLKKIRVNLTDEFVFLITMIYF